MLKILNMTELLNNQDEGWVIVNSKNGTSYGYNLDGYFIKVTLIGKFKLYKKIQKDANGDDLLHLMGGLEYTNEDDKYEYATFEEAFAITEKKGV